MRSLLPADRRTADRPLGPASSFRRETTARLLWWLGLGSGQRRRILGCQSTTITGSQNTDMDTPKSLLGESEGLPDAEFWLGMPGGPPPPGVVLGGCVLPPDGEDRVAQISGTKVDQGYDEAEDQIWVDVKDGEGQVWHIRWDASP
ncbi:MAG: hypothetical protein OXB92_06070 [Acidimicrobiaceae bacterium]|nr:hypothetical protein [Acidimicrobiaceae bacterium]